jgi:hypothetical protein
MGMAKWGWFLALILSLSFALSGCADPYQRELKGILYSDGEAKRIAAKLEPQDAELFVRWSTRMSTSDRFNGEANPVTVRGALINQKRFEQVAQEKANEEARLAAERLEVEQQKQRLVKTHELISQFIDTEFLTYQYQPIYGGNGLEVAREWLLYFKITNNTNGELVGLRGEIYIADAFAKELGYIPTRHETSIRSGESRKELVRFMHDPKNPMHRQMIGTQSLRAQWFFDSLALQDGRVVDSTNVDAWLKSEAEAAANPETETPP